MKYLQNLHTHTVWCDGKDTPEELVEAAIKKGFDSLGFSGHSYMFFSPHYGMSAEKEAKYKRDIKELKKKYDGEIDLFCGIEFEMYSKVDLSDYDYVIGSAHYILKDGEYLAMDRQAEPVKQIIDEHFHGDGMKYAKAYYETLAKLPEYADVDIVGHFDLLTKHSEKENFFDADSCEYKNIALETLHTLAEKFDIFEVNTGAIARGYRTTPYPAPFLLKELHSMGKKIVISSDCHDCNFLDCNFKEAEELVKECGFGEIYVLKKSGFSPVKL